MPDVIERVEALETRADSLTGDVGRLRQAIRILLEQAAREGWSIDARAVALMISPGQTIPIPVLAGPMPPPRGARSASGPLPNAIRSRAKRLRAAIDKAEASGDTQRATVKRAELEELLAAARPASMVHTVSPVSDPQVDGASRATDRASSAPDSDTTSDTRHDTNAPNVSDRVGATRHESDTNVSDRVAPAAPLARGSKNFLSLSEGPMEGPKGSSLSGGDPVSGDRSLENPSPSSPINHVPDHPARAREPSTPERENDLRDRENKAKVDAQRSASDDELDAAELAKLPKPPDDHKATEPRLWAAVEACAAAYVDAQRALVIEEAFRVGRAPTEAELEIPAPAFAGRKKTNSRVRWILYQACKRADGVLERAGLPVAKRLNGGRANVRTDAIAAAFYLFASSKPGVRWMRFYAEAAEWAKTLIARLGLEQLRRGNAINALESGRAPASSPSSAATPKGARKGLSAPRASF